MKRRHRSFQHLQPRLFSLLALILFLFGLFSYSFLFSLFNSISGAETAGGTVSLNIAGTIGGGGGEEAQRARNEGRLLSLELEIIPKEITVEIQQFQGKLLQLLLRNRSGDKTFDLTITTPMPMLHLSEDRLVLPPGAEKTLLVQVDTSQVGIFVGSITFEGLFAFKQIPVLIHVFTPVSYTLDVTIPASHKVILTNQDIFADIALHSLSQGIVNLTYMIKDSANTVLLRETEEALVTRPTLAFQKTFDLPDNLPLGRYYLLVESNYQGTQAQDADSFTVAETLSATEEYPFQIYRQSPLVFFLIVLAIIFLHILMTRTRKH